MIYHSLSDFLIAIFYFFTYGVIVAGIYISQNIIVLWFKKIIRIPSHIFKRRKISTKLKEKKNLISKNELSSFFFFLLFGIGYIILQYVALDGAFRLFFLIIFLFGFFISKKSAGELIKIVLNFLFEILYKIAFFIFKIFLFPLYIVFKITAKLFMPLLKLFKRVYSSLKSRGVAKGNIKKIDKILKRI